MKTIQPDSLASAETIYHEKYYIQQDVTYVFPDGHKLDVYLPGDFFENKEAQYPAVLNIHGGGWHEGNKTKGIAVRCAEMLAAAGYVVFTIDYTLNTDDALAWPQNLRDCQMAFQYMRDYAGRYKVDRKRMAILGNSAGGHLALLTAFSLPDADKPRCVIDMYGISDVRLWGRDAFVCDGASDADDILKQVSPVMQVAENSPAVLLLHGNNDTIVPLAQSELLVQKLNECNVEHRFIIVDGGGHGFTPYPDSSNGKRDLRNDILKFLHQHLD